jgi:flavin reductase (DIM6/NTAB) family NADH-FMN oxidoreductase RutF
VHRDGPALDPADYRHVMSRLASGVTVVSADDGGRRHGMTVNAIVSVSLDPLLMLFCCERRAALHDPLLRAGVWAVSVLTASQADVSRCFATREQPGEDQFTQWQTRQGDATGAPILSDALAWFECRTWATYAGGDHTIVVGEVVAAGVQHDVEPLVYFRSDYTTAAD